MKITKRSLIILLLTAILFSCEYKKDEERKIITSRIQYDVYIKSPDSQYVWWRENIPGPDREKLVNWIMDKAYSGDIEAYDYFNKPLTVEQVKSIGKDTIYRTLMRTEAPFEKYDTMVVKSLELQDIKKIRFLEEWYYDKNNDLINKEIIGVSPVIERYNDEGEFIANQPLFWLYFKEGYAQKMKKVK